MTNTDTTSNLNKFMAEFEKCLREGHMRNPDMYKASLHESVIKMRAQLTAPKPTGSLTRAARQACVNLGIPQTMSAVRKYIGVTK